MALDGAEVTTAETLNTRRSRKRRVESSSRSLSSGFDETGVPNTNLMRRIWSSTVASQFGKDHLPMNSNGIMAVMRGCEV